MSRVGVVFRFRNSKLEKRSEQLKQKDYVLARGLAIWKTRVRRRWQAIGLVDLQAPDTFNRSWGRWGHIFR